MVTLDPTELLIIIEASGPYLLFILMFLEGPIVTYTAAFLSSQGIFNIYLVFILSTFGNVIPDIILFLIGKYSRTGRIEKMENFFGLNSSRMEKMEKRFNKHAGKTIIFSKLVPGIAIPGMILAGFSKISFKKFLFISFIFNVSSAMLFTCLGFYSGITISNFMRYLNVGKYILIILFLNIVIIYFLIKFINKHFLNKNNTLKVI